MTTTTTTTGAPAPAGLAAGGACRYPGCPNLARVKDHAAPGPRPGYCEQEVPEDRGDGTVTPVRHTAMTAFRRREQLAGQPASGRPVTAAIGRAAAIRDDALAAVTRLSGQLTAALDQLAAIGEQLAAAADPLAVEAQAETVAALDRQAAARQHDLAAIHDAREETARAQRERDDALAAAGTARRDAAAAREHDARQHAAALAASAARLDAASDTIAALRVQADRAEAAPDRERAGHHRTVTLLHGLITRPDTASAGQHPRAPEPAPPAGPAGRRRPRAPEPPAGTDTERTRP